MRYKARVRSHGSKHKVSNETKVKLIFSLSLSPFAWSLTARRWRQRKRRRQWECYWLMIKSKLLFWIKMALWKTKSRKEWKKKNLFVWNMNRVFRMFCRLAWRRVASNLFSSFAVVETHANTHKHDSMALYIMLNVINDCVILLSHKMFQFWLRLGLVLLSFDLRLVFRAPIENAFYEINSKLS